MTGSLTADEQLRTFLGELRTGVPVDCAAVVAEMSLEEGKRHAAAELRGEYADVEPIEPAMSIVGDVLTLRTADGDEIAFEVEWEAIH